MIVAQKSAKGKRLVEIIHVNIIPTFFVVYFFKAVIPKTLSPHLKPCHPSKKPPLMKAQKEEANNCRLSNEYGLHLTALKRRCGAVGDP